MFDTFVLLQDPFYIFSLVRNRAYFYSGTKSLAAPCIIYTFHITVSFRVIQFSSIKENMFYYAGSSLLCGLFSRCSTGASPCDGFSSYGAQAIWHADFSSRNAWAQ